MTEIFEVPTRGIGTPDYSSPKPIGQVPKPTTFTLTDMGELAARLGSIVTFDRRGDIIWLDDFEAPRLNWITGATGVGVAPVIANDNSYSGAQSVHFFVPAGAGNSQLRRFFPIVKYGKAGAEFLVNGANASPAFLECRLDIYDGTNNTVAELRINYGFANNIAIDTPDGWKIIDNTFTTFFNQLYIPVKMVVDMDDDKYVRLLVGPEEYDISAYSMINVGATTVRYMMCRFWFGNGAAVDTEVWVDNFALTQNEP